MSAIVFKCKFCDKKAQSQNSIDTHTLFEHNFLMPSCSTDYESEVENYLFTKDKFKTCLICSAYTIGYIYPDTDIYNLKNILCDRHYTKKNLQIYTQTLQDALENKTPRSLKSFKKHFLEMRIKEIETRKNYNHDIELRPSLFQKWLNQREIKFADLPYDQRMKLIKQFNEQGKKRY